MLKRATSVFLNENFESISYKSSLFVLQTDIMQLTGTRVQQCH